MGGGMSGIAATYRLQQSGILFLRFEQVLSAVGILRMAAGYFLLPSEPAGRSDGRVVRGLRRRRSGDPGVAVDESGGRAS